MKSPLETLQPLGRALMLPIAVLPVAGLLLRLGQPDLLDIALLSAAGEAIFGHLGLLFAIGVATGFARDGNGAACLAGVTCYLVATQGAQALMTVPAAALADVAAPAIDLATAAWKARAIGRVEVPLGIASGLIGGSFYNRFSGVALPEYLAFFGGRRFAPIVSGLAGLGFALIVGLGFAAISAGIDALSYAVIGAGGYGLFAYGLLNRLLLVTGLHHLLNNIAWFVVGDYHGKTGDLGRFFAGDPSAGAFMAGFFPVMMFGLPAACLAMYHAAAPDRRKAVGGMLFSLALTSALTGVTEPIEFSFMFLAPVLYALHAVLTGVSMALMNALGVKLGFGFSAGLFDYVLNYGNATRPLLLVPVGLAYAAVYYGLFRVVIQRLNLPTPGREREPGVATPKMSERAKKDGRGPAFASALGGAANLTSVDACTTRLRLIVADQSLVDDARLKALGARGVIRPSANALQIVLGPVADTVAMEIREAMADGAAAPADPMRPAPTDTGVTVAAVLALALGGSDNVVGASRHGDRLRIALVDADRLSQTALQALRIRAIVRLPDGVIHLLPAPEAMRDLVSQLSPA